MIRIITIMKGLVHVGCGKTVSDCGRLKLEGALPPVKGKLKLFTNKTH